MLADVGNCACFISSTNESFTNVDEILGLLVGNKQNDGDFVGVVWDDDESKRVYITLSTEESSEGFFEENKLYILIGSVVLVVLIIIIVTVCCCCCCRKKNSAQEDSEVSYKDASVNATKDESSALLN